jgi:hypothetical protein|tara:strand:+ start:5877 stop:6293 length:417 start_codon:yes stop_codon:yes gene_type:complete
MSYQVIKLSNGEDIVCEVLEIKDTQINISEPLKMETINKVTDNGASESLALGRWLQPYSDENVFQIERNSIVIMTPASIGLIKYYEYVMTTIERMELSSVEATDKDLESIVEQEIIDEDLSLDEIVKSFRKSNINIYH